MAYTIVQPSDFIGEIQIANKTQSDVSADLAYFIAKYQAKFLKELLGESFFALFDTGMNADPQEARFVTLAQQLTSACADYIFYYYQRDQVTQTVGVGNVQTKAANAVVTSGGKKLSRAWNEMVGYVYGVIKFITDNPDIYPEYILPNWLRWRMCDRFWWEQDYYLYPFGFGRVPDIFNSINDFNI